MQKKYTEQQKKNKKYNPSDFDEYDFQMWSVMVGSIILMIGLVVLISIFHEDERNECEKIGGNFVVVDEHYTGKAIIDIYGCVK